MVQRVEFEKGKDAEERDENENLRVKRVGVGEMGSESRFCSREALRQSEPFHFCCSCHGSCQLAPSSPMRCDEMRIDWTQTDDVRWRFSLLY